MLIGEYTMPMITFVREKASDVFDEALPLLRAHWEEIAHYKDIPLDPDREQYRLFDEAGMLRTYTARTDKWELVGYAVFFVRPNAHYKSSLQAVQDIIFISKDHRGGTGAKFILWCDEQLRAEGVQVVYHHVKAAHNFGPLLERFGYKLVDLIYARRFD